MLAASTVIDRDFNYGVKQALVRRSRYEWHSCRDGTANPTTTTAAPTAWVVTAVTKRITRSGCRQCFCCRVAAAAPGSSFLVCDWEENLDGRTWMAAERRAAELERFRADRAGHLLCWWSARWLSAAQTPDEPACPDPR